MMFFDGIDDRQDSTRPRRATRPGRPRRVRRTLPDALERLEDRRLLSTFTVTNTGDLVTNPDGTTAVAVGSLRAAVLAADADTGPGQDTIAFAIPGTGLHTIQPSGPLPGVSRPVLIDGYSQPGSSENTLAVGDNAVLTVQLDGINAGTDSSSSDGLVLGGGCTVRGLVIDRFFRFQVFLLFGPNDVVEGNFIGTDPTGTQVLEHDGSVHYDLVISASNNSRIGTDGNGVDDLGERNVISGGHIAAIHLFNCTGDVVAGNYIGTDKNGTSALGYDEAGVRCNGGGPNRIGVNTADADPSAEANLISGHEVGVNLWNATAYQIQGNLIGTDATGTRPVANFQPDPGNLGNFFGIDGDGNGNQIGGTTPNVIAFNGTGVILLGSGVGNSIRGNSIFDNTVMGIDLGQDGVTPNTPGGPHAGPNALQNFPAIAAVTGGPATHVSGTLNSTPGETFTLDFYANGQGDSAGSVWGDSTSTRYGEGRRWLGSISNVTTDASGNTSFDALLPASMALGESISATATGSEGTSEFAADVIVVQVATVTSLTSSSNPALLGQTVTLTATVNDGGGTPTGAVDFYDGATMIGTGTLTGSAVATFSTAALATGTHGLTAFYPGDANDLTSTSGPVAQVVIPPASLSGVVFSDFNDDGQVDFGETGVSGVPITLTGTDDLGHAVNLSQTTDAAGTYVFLNLRPATYTITEAQQPAGYTPGIASVGTGGGTVSGAQLTVSLPAGVDAMNYNYGERPVATGRVHEGQTAGIGFWNNKHGQALIKALNGGVGTQLGDWLAATFPHMFGQFSGGNSLAGKDNAFVASFFQSRFVVHGQKLDAQVLATALAVYVTDPVLDNTGVGTPYGFTVGGDGVATATFNVGDDGAAFGVANSTKVTVMDLLLAADAQALNGVLYNGDAVKRNEANDVFSDINEAGGI